MSDDADRLHAALVAAWDAFADLLEGGRVEHRDGYIWSVFPSVPVPQFNGVWPIDDSSAAALEGALAEVRELGLAYSVQVRAGRTPAVEREAERLGLLVESELPGMLVHADELREVEAEGLHVIRVRTGDGLAQALAVAAEGFAAPPEILAPLYVPEVASTDGVGIYLGRSGDVDVTTATGITIDDAVGVYTVATPTAHRGHGYGAAITAHAVRDGFAAGARFAYLQSSSLGYPVYRRLGFREVERYLLYTAPEAPAVEVIG